MAEDIKEWTNLLGLSETPTGTDTPKSGTTHQFWKNSCGYTVYETFSLSGVGHAVPFDGNAVAAYFGLDKAAAYRNPETAACSGGAGFGRRRRLRRCRRRRGGRGQGRWRGRWRRWARRAEAAPAAPALAARADEEELAAQRAETAAARAAALVAR